MKFSNQVTMTTSARLYGITPGWLLFNWIYMIESTSFNGHDKRVRISHPKPVILQSWIHTFLKIQNFKIKKDLWLQCLPIMSCSKWIRRGARRCFWKIRTQILFTIVICDMLLLAICWHRLLLAVLGLGFCKPKVVTVLTKVEFNKK